MICKRLLKLFIAIIDHTHCNMKHSKHFLIVNQPIAAIQDTLERHNSMIY